MFGHNKATSWLENFSPKNAFILGLIGAILLMCTIGFFVLLFNFVKNGSLNDVAQNQAAPVNNQADLPSPSDLSANLLPITDRDHLRGNKKAAVYLIEFSDFQCPYCEMVDPTLKQLVEDYNGQVAWVYKHLPLDSLHSLARQAAEASECASEQGKFWEYADELYANQSKISPDYFGQLARSLNLDASQFDNCLESGKYADVVKQNETEAQSVGVTGTPGIYVNDILIKGAVPYDSFKQVIDSLLN